MAELHKLFSATVLCHTSDIGVKEANASFKECYDFDAEFSAASFRLWTCSRYTMINIKYFVLWLAQHPRTTFRKSIEIAASYGVSKMDAIMIRSHLDLTRVRYIDPELITVVAQKKALAFFDKLGWCLTC